MPEKILVVDENEQVHSILSDILAEERVAVLSALNMEDGRKMLKAQFPDLVIADVGMPIAELLGMLPDGGQERAEVDLIVLACGADQAAGMEWLDKGVYDCVPVSPEDTRLLVAAVRRALQKRRLALRNKCLIKELDQSVAKDPLTGLFNHRVMYKSLLNEIVRSSRYNHNFLLLIVDIDNLKAINEVHGLKYGDFVLARAARQLEVNLRMTDTTFRFEGGKFLILLPETLKSQAVCIAERLIEAIRYHDFSCDEIRAQVTVSIGAAEFPTEARDVTSLLWLADLRLTGAKNAGRDCFCFKTYETLPSHI